MSSATTPLDVATEVLRQAGFDGLTVLDTRPLEGGMICRVEAWRTDGEPATLVAKSQGDGLPGEIDGDLTPTLRSLEWMAVHAELLLPRPYGLVARGERQYLLMQHLPGRHLGQARLTETGRAWFEAELADHLVTLHGHTRATYGSALEDPGEATWLAWFEPRLRGNVDETRGRLSAEARASCDRLLDRLPDWLPECDEPTLVHGDLWHANILVDDADPDHPRITGFLDGGSLFADVEYELAYLQVFGLVGERFLDLYAQRRPLREGFARRCRVYWLNTLLLHLWLFGPAYLARCERLAREVAALA